MDMTQVNLLKIPAQYVLKAAKTVKKLAYLIAVIGAVTSYGTQVDLMKRIGIDGMFAYLIPATIDLLTICAAIALQVPGLPSRWKKEIGIIMVVGLAVSIYANVDAGHNTGQKIWHAWPVIAYMLAEYIANRLRTFAALVQAAQDAKSKPEEELPAPVKATATVIKTPPTPLPSKPGTAKSKILELASVTPPLSPEAIADQVGVKPGWVKHVIKTTA
jgi:hypothetical protein